MRRCNCCKKMRDESEFAEGLKSCAHCRHVPNDYLPPPFRLVFDEVERVCHAVDKATGRVLTTANAAIWVVAEMYHTVEPLKAMYRDEGQRSLRNNYDLDDDQHTARRRRTR